MTSPQATYESLTADAATLIGVPVEDVRQKLGKAGIRTAAMLATVRRETFQDAGFLPAEAEAMSVLFRGDAGNGGQHQALVEALRQPAQMSNAELVRAVNPRSPSEPAARELAARFPQLPILVPQDSSEELNPAATLELIRLHENGETLDGQYVYPSGQRVETYPVGEWVSQVFEESPVVEGRALAQGRCPETRVDFSAIDLTRRQLIRLAVLSGELRPTVRADVTNAVRAARRGLEDLRLEFPQAAAEFDTLSRLGKLPSLKLARPRTGGTDRRGAFDRPNRRY